MRKQSYKMSLQVLASLLALFLFACNNGGGTAAVDQGAGSDNAVEDLSLAGAQTGDLSWVNPLYQPYRITQGADGKFYASAPKANSVFIFDANLQIVGELKGQARPLGVAVDEAGFIYVGNQGRQNVEVYNSKGGLVRVIDKPAMGTPNELGFDKQGRLNVLDTTGKKFHTFAKNGKLVESLDLAGYAWPMSFAYAPNGELFIADQGSEKIHVYNADRIEVRSFGKKMEAFSTDWQGKFVQLSSLAFDAQGRLHVCDQYLMKVQVLDPKDGAFISAYGVEAKAGEHRSLIDIAISKDGAVVGTNTLGSTVDLIHTLGN